MNRDGNGAVTIEFRPTGSVPPGTSGSMTIQAQRCTYVLICFGWTTLNTTTVEGRRANPSTDQLGLTCVPPETGIGSGASGNVNCSINGRRTLGAPVTFTSISVALPNGWTATSLSGEMSDGTLDIPLDATIGASESHPVSFSISPSCAAPAMEATFSVSSTFRYRDASFTGPETSFIAGISGTRAPESVTASLVGGEALPPLPYSLEPQLVANHMRIEVENPEQCVGWNVDISASDLAYAGNAPGQPNLTASSLRVMQPGGEVLVLSSELQRLISNGGPEQQYVFGVDLVIPGGAPAGTYSGTVTLVTSAAPGMDP